MRSLEKKVIFLTGGSLGIGFECARKYRDEGATVVVIANDEASLLQTRQELGAGHTVLFGDVSVAADVKSAIEHAIQQYGRIDVIHNNAGIAHPACRLHETSDEEWKRLFEINVTGILHTTRYGIDALIASVGCIINTGSIVAAIGQGNHAAYAATKGAVDALTRSMAIDYAAYRIRVNAVAPAGVWTPMLRKWGQEQVDPGGIERYLNSIHLLGYCPEGAVIADVCAFLASEQARFITGAIVPVTGGAELGYRRTVE